MSDYNLQYTWSGFDAASRVISGSDFQDEFEAIQVAVNSKADASNIGIVEAWVNFNGSAATAVINDSFNVTSITDRGTGWWKINMTNAISTAYPAIVGNGGGEDRVINLDHADVTTTDFDIYSRNIDDGQPRDTSMVTIAVIT